MTELLALMDKYRDTPIMRLFTVDSDFYVYRLADGMALEVIR